MKVVPGPSKLGRTCRGSSTHLNRPESLVFPSHLHVIQIILRFQRTSNIFKVQAAHADSIDWPRFFRGFQQAHRPGEM